MRESAESLVGSALALASLLLYLYGMAARLVSPNSTGGWVEEISIYLMIWGLLLASSSCVARGEHIRVDFLISVLGPSFSRLASVLAAAAGLLFCMALAWFGWQVVEFAIRLDERGPSYLQIPTWWYYMSLPVSMAICSARYLWRLAAAILGRDG